MRNCDGCNTPLPGKRGHGFVVNGQLLCGRRETDVTRVNSKGERVLRRVSLPCAKQGG